LSQGELSTFGTLTRPSETESQIDTAKSASQNILDLRQDHSERQEGALSRILVQLSDLSAGYFDYSGE